MKFSHHIWLLLVLISTVVAAQQKDPAWDSADSADWPPPFRLVKIESTTDKSIQKSWYYESRSTTLQPLIISLHTWSGDYSQQDPLANEAVLRNWNYIHPDFRGINNKPEACGSPLVITDLEDVIRFAIRQGHTDSNNIHIIGVSGGGYATLLAFMKLKYPVKSFSAWVPISDLRSWYWESKGRKAKYADDIEKIAMKNGRMNWKLLDRRSPLLLPYPAGQRKNAALYIYAGIHDGYSGSVPISHSLLFYNKIAAAQNPNNKKSWISESMQRSLLTKQINPEADSNFKLNNRAIHLSRRTERLSITIFEGGHEMLVPSALSLIPADNIKNMEKISILCIGDSNGATSDGWPVQLQKLLPFSTIINTCISGNTIGFDNLGQSRLNTLSNIDSYLNETSRKSGPAGLPDYIIIGLGTNDTKAIYHNRQQEVSDNFSLLLEKISQYYKSKQLKVPKICILLPPPVDEQKADTLKYGGSDKRIQVNNPFFRSIADKHQATTIDLYKFLSEDISEQTKDGIHLTEKAQFRAAGLIVQFINSKNRR